MSAKTLAHALRNDYRSEYGQWPTDEEIAALEAVATDDEPTTRRKK